ncbi:MAG: serine/threonine protein kinase [Anaerolineae bacterium]|nr:serine/threonine protein kinase [Anaerolineae bacterium]
MSTGPLPDTIGPYVVREKIGSGGMAIVYRAYDARKQRDVALKVLARHRVDSENARLRFERETRTLIGFKHPHILPVYDYGEDNGVPYLVMRLLTGHSLGDLMRGKVLTINQVGQITREIASALDYAHARGIIHRDIKPSNILLDAAGKPFLADFGVAYVIQQGPRLTTEGGFIGTAAYASPEQCKGEAIGRPSDIYSLAVMVYEMFTRRPLFEAPSSLALMKKHMLEPPPNPIAHNPNLPLELYAVLARALAKLPDERFPSALRFSEALDAALHLNVMPRGVDDDSWLHGEPPPPPPAWPPPSEPEPEPVFTAQMAYEGVFPDIDTPSPDASESPADDTAQEDTLAADTSESGTTQEPAWNTDEAMPTFDADSDLAFDGEPDDGDPDDDMLFADGEIYAGGNLFADIDSIADRFDDMDGFDLDDAGSLADDAAFIDDAFVDDVLDPLPASDLLDDDPPTEFFVPEKPAPLEPAAVPEDTPLEAPRIQPLTASKRGPTPGSVAWWQRMPRDQLTIYVTIAVSAVALVIAIVALVVLLHDPGPSLGATYRNPGLDIVFDYPENWTTVTANTTVLSPVPSATVILADQPVAPNGPYDTASIVLAVKWINPTAVYGIPRACQNQIGRGPADVFACMKHSNYVTPVYDPFDTSRYAGTRLPGTLPPDPASQPIILLPAAPQSWLAIVIVHWRGYDDARDVLDAIAHSVRPR